ncbi:hypothetical protein STEG23_025947 [Scotinomys teguina]
MWFVFTMEYYAPEKNNDTMKFAGKWMELENVIRSKIDRSYSIVKTPPIKSWMPYNSFCIDNKKSVKKRQRGSVVVHTYDSGTEETEDGG